MLPICYKQKFEERSMGQTQKTKTFTISIQLVDFKSFQTQNSVGGFNLVSLLTLSLSVFSSSPFQTISSRHKHIFPYLSRKRRSVGGFPHTSFKADVMAKMTSATSKKASRDEKQSITYQPYNQSHKRLNTFPVNCYFINHLQHKLHPQPKEMPP